MWNIIQCAVQGRGHKKSNTPCQDKTYSISTNNMQIIALADGAGSAKLSHYGAETVTKFICIELAKNFDIYFSNNNGVIVKQQLIKKLLKNLNEKALELKCALNELASTLLFVAIKNEQFIIAHIGDGVIGYLKNNNLKIASQPENGEFINTTVFTTSKNVIMSMKLFKGYLGQIQGFVLMSDGTETSFYNKKEHKLADILKKIMHLSTIISSTSLQKQLKQSFENIIIKSTTDDCSIAMLVKQNKDFQGYMQLSNIQKCILLQINPKTKKRIIKRYDDILINLINKQSLSQIAHTIHLKNKYTKKYINKLYSLNYIEKHNFYYHTILIMNTQY